MRAISIILAFFVLAISTMSFAEEKKDELRFTVAPEIGYVSLKGPASDNLENAMGYGATFSYHIKPFLRAELPILVSSHKAKDMPGNTDASLTLVSFTPGLAIGTKGKMRLWFFWGMGGTLVNSKFEVGHDSAEDKDLAFATNMRGGLEYSITKNLSTGFALGVMTAAMKAKRINLPDKWTTYEYYTTMFRIGYSF